jgi:predicted DNA-binding ribbon-helix-helix protein
MSILLTLLFWYIVNEAASLRTWQLQQLLTSIKQDHQDW